MGFVLLLFELCYLCPNDQEHIQSISIDFCVIIVYESSCLLQYCSFLVEIDSDLKHIHKNKPEELLLL